MHKPVFVCGFPKSGTTLIAQLFNNLPDTFIDIELHFAPFFLRMIRDTLLSGEIMTTVKSPDPLAERIMQLSNNDFEDYYEWCKTSFGSLHTGWKQGIRWGNNCKPIIDHVPVLRKLFPEAIVINMMRDPRDVWASIKLAKWNGLEYFNDMTFFLSRYRYIYLTASQDGIFTLKYEDLVNDPQTAFDLIGEKFKPEYIAGTGKTFHYRTLPIPPSKPWSEMRDEVMTSRIGRYKTDLPDYEIEIIEDAFGDILEKHYS